MQDQTNNLNMIVATLGIAFWLGSIFWLLRNYLGDPESEIMKKNFGRKSSKTTN